MHTSTASSILDDKWENLLDTLEQIVGKRPSDLNGVLFLIGMQELGRGPKRYSKEQKQDLLHVAVCTVLSQSGYYISSGLDKDNWPQFDLLKPLPSGDILAQEDLLKSHVLLYFDSMLNS
ncbi:hypothetical protein [Fibrella forsythiae]|uniref:Uncharacterized protein n=1 Tax=Fibrella forsythiae TaxID=2817061 RepID=A0ABS3JL89_9BACT|nr:hypothetical protein [Fibrella forsythiae]MBO0950203.1 hypothetical protein [Fibrella forsythiae]